MAFRWLYVGLKDPLPYVEKWGHLSSYASFAPETASHEEKDQRVFTYYLLGNGLKWEGWENHKEFAKHIISSTRFVEGNCSSPFKCHTKTTFAIGNIFRKDDGLMGIICKEHEQQGMNIEGKPLGFGFMTEIWNNNLPEITEQDLVKYMRPLTRFVMLHPKSAKILGIYYGSITDRHRQT